jgi:hypothetical protein
VVGISMLGVIPTSAKNSGMHDGKGISFRLAATRNHINCARRTLQDMKLDNQDMRCIVDTSKRVSQATSSTVQVMKLSLTKPGTPGKINDIVPPTAPSAGWDIDLDIDLT